MTLALHRARRPMGVRPPNVVDRTGQTIGAWRVLRETLMRDPSGCIVWLCEHVTTPGLCKALTGPRLRELARKGVK